MKSIKSIITLVALIFITLLVACGPSADSRYDTGYNDGYAEGYNTTCKIRSTLVEGDWEDQNYSRGYNDGRSDGVANCRSGK